MSSLYLDQVGGVSGDMFLGALIDLGLDPGELDRALRGLGLEGFRLEVQAVTRAGFDATRLIVHVGNVATPRGPDPEGGGRPAEAPRPHGHDHHDHHDHGHPHHVHPAPSPEGEGAAHAHPHRRYSEIAAMISASTLSPAVKSRALAVFLRLGEAEATVHRVALDQVHFHEVGAVDSIVDIVGVCWGLDRLGITRIESSPFVLGRGQVEMAHGRWPVPAPATLRLLEGFACEFTTLIGETVTPTGAALVTTLADRVGAGVQITPRRVGAGAGAREWPDRPNILRAILGAPPPSSDRVEVLETAIDDMTPQLVAALVARLFEGGALDVLTLPAGMKKGRQGWLVTVLARVGEGAALAGIIFSESTTLGIRNRIESRWILGRRMARVSTPWGDVAVKIAVFPDGKSRQTPEFDDCLRVAQEAGVAVAEVVAAARVGTPHSA